MMNNDNIRKKVGKSSYALKKIKRIKLNVLVTQ